MKSSTRDLRVILIGGTSHTGKSTVAKRIAEKIDAICVSTDSLARHPGRPWGATGARPHVARYYLELSDDERLRSVLVHYRNLWPLIERGVRKHVSDQLERPLVFEGSGLLPENAVHLAIPGVAAVWLTGKETLLRSRIYKESDYERQGDRGRKMIDAFVTRAGDFDRAVMDSVRKLNLPSLEVRDGATIEELARECLERMRPLA
jgi:2-phosphoglycerate kinase